MDMKKLSNMNAYWAKSERIIYCVEIASLLTRKTFLALLQYFHIINSSTYTMDKEDLRYNKMHQTQSLINKIRDVFKEEWKLRQIITVDETMIRYKGKYCPASQYMPKKPIKWRLKV